MDTPSITCPIIACVYVHVHVGMTLKGVLVPLERVDRRPARKRKRKPEEFTTVASVHVFCVSFSLSVCVVSPEEEATTLPLTVINRHGVREDIGIYTYCSRLLPCNVRRPDFGILPPPPPPSLPRPFLRHSEALFFV